MIWFFFFTSLGVALTLFLLTLKTLMRLGWKTWLGGFAYMAALFLLVFKLPA